MPRHFVPTGSTMAKGRRYTRVNSVLAFHLRYDQIETRPYRVELQSVNDATITAFSASREGLQVIYDAIGSLLQEAAK